MQLNARRDRRSSSKRTYTISWKDDGQITHSSEVRGVDISDSGLGLHCPFEVGVGSTVYVQADEGGPEGYATVRHCTRRNSSFIMGLELHEDTKNPRVKADDSINYYEFLQISPNAETETIHRVYRFLAARYHPDNPDTGDPEKFVRLNQAFEVLSDRQLRAAYDASLHGSQDRPLPGFESVDYMDGVEGEVNRRLAVLSLLYRRCRANVESRTVTLPDLEKLMGFPREYLDFTTWYLKAKKLITREDNSDFSLTALGVDYVESNYSKLPLLRKLLNAGSSPATDSPADDHRSAPRSHSTFALGPGHLEPMEEN